MELRKIGTYREALLQIVIWEEGSTLRGVITAFSLRLERWNYFPPDVVEFEAADIAGGGIEILSVH